MSPISWSYTFFCFFGEEIGARLMVLKTGTVKEPENVLITGFMVEPMTS